MKFPRIRSARLASALGLIAALSLASTAFPADAPATPGPATPFQGFLPRVAIPVLRNAHSVVADDLNEDGHLDLIVATAAADSVAVLAGHGDGRFDPPVYWPVGTKPKFAVTGDFNRDGHRDIVVADQDSNTVSVLLGVGDGTFKPRVSYAACRGTHEVAVADFNGDGKDDVAVACHGKPYSASVFLGNGDGTLGPRLDLHPGAEPAAVVVGDFNKDGIPDLAFANHAGGSIGVLLGKGDGSFGDPVEFATATDPHGLRTADFNGDGILDLVSVNDGSNSVSVLLGKGDGTFGEHFDLPANSAPKSVAAADVDGDGHPDIVITNDTYPTCCTVEGSTISVFLNRGDGPFGPRQDYDSGGNGFSLLVRDLNGDGKADIATANFLDQSVAQHAYLQAAHALGLASRPAKAVGLLLICLAGAAVGLLAWRRFRWAGLACSRVVTLVLAGCFYRFTKLRTTSDAHVSILFRR